MTSKEDQKDKDKQTNPSTKNKIIKIEKEERFKIFLLLSFINILTNMDHGTLPAASNEIKQDFNINDTELGSFGSLVYLGKLIGALFLSKIIDIVNRKILLLITLLLISLLIFTFISFSAIWFLFINRILIGIGQVFITVYFPVWIDQYGPREWKTGMMSVFNLTSPIGVMFGYILTMLVKDDFNVSFYYKII